MRTLLLLLFLSACASRSDAAKAYLQPMDELTEGALLSPQGGKVSPRELKQRAETARFILVGESHEVACDHRAQAAVLAELYGAGYQPGVGLEMVAVDKQPVLDRFTRGELTPDRVDDELDWPGTWGFPYELYAIVFEQAAAAKAPVVALNAPEAVVKKVAEVGLETLSEPEKAGIVAQLIFPLPEQRKMLEDEFARHAKLGHGGGGTADVERFIRVQSLWDTQMAHTAARWVSENGRPMVIFAGGGHVVNGWGIEHRLATLAPGADVLSIMPWRGEGPLPDKEADLFFFCPAE